jgi:hypothetical protein
LKEIFAGLSDGFGCSVTKKLLCALVPGTNLALVGYNESGV